MDHGRDCAVMQTPSVGNSGRVLTLRSLTTHPLAFTSGDPVRAASAVTRIHDHWLIAQDDATHAALWREGPAHALRVFASIDGADTFSDSDGNKRLKPDLESACTVEVAGGEAALLLGSGSLAARMRGALVMNNAGEWNVATADLDPLYERVAAALDIDMKALNLEGACVVGSTLRWFQRGHGSDVASAGVDLELRPLLAALHGDVDPSDIALHAVTPYDLGAIDGVALAITDAATLPDGRIIVSAAAEDAPNAVDDGPIVGSAIAIIDGTDVAEVLALPASPDGDVWKVEGLAVRSATNTNVELLAVVDQDDPGQPSLALELTLQTG